MDEQTILLAKTYLSTWFAHHPSEITRDTIRKDTEDISEIGELDFCPADQVLSAKLIDISFRLRGYRCSMM